MEAQHVDEQERDAFAAGEVDAAAYDREGEEPEEPSADALAELAAVAEAESDDVEAARTELERTRAALEAERAATREAVARYRAAALAAEPEIPAELVQGETLEAVDASLEAARRAVAQIRERLAAQATHEAAAGGFPVGAPSRRGVGGAGLSAGEKIARGLAER